MLIACGALYDNILRKSHGVSSGWRNDDTDYQCLFVGLSKRRRSCATDKRIRFREVNCPAAGIKAEIPAAAVCLRTGQTVMQTVLPRARSLGFLLLFGSKLNAARVWTSLVSRWALWSGKILVATVCGPLVRGSLLGLHGNTAREEKYISFAYPRAHENHTRDRLELTVANSSRI